MNRFSMFRGSPRPSGLAGLALAALALTLQPSPARAQVDHSGMIASYEGAQTCLNCHGQGGFLGQQREVEIMATTHWTWIHTNTAAGVTQVLGKQNVVNNYCVALPSNEPRCTSCHVGVGWRDNTFDFTDKTKIDCLVCHDGTGTYKKTPTGAGAPDPSVDLLAVARSVGPTSRATCGTCHFFGGGGDAVKHGDLDSTMFNPSRELDVHMGVDGLNQNCTFCHASDAPGTTDHDLVGSRYSKSAPDSWLCEDCHTSSPHSNPDLADRLNAHTDRVACQSCHIPYYARGGKATKMSWDWSTAGVKNPDGSDLVIKDADGNPIYDTKKGTFTWKANVVPEYVWFNGEVLYTTLDDVVDSSQMVTLNTLQGDLNDTKARIVPVKRFTGLQPFDADLNTLAVPHLFPSGPTDTNAYWKGYNWTNALTAGMAYVGRSFSGNVGWLRTEMFWIQNHMVAPREQALTCTDCHTPRGRLDFLALGYPEQQALLLQTMAGFEINVELVTSPAGRAQLNWMGTPGHRYQVELSSDLSNPSGWTPAPDGERVTGSEPEPMTWSEDISATEGLRFYRVIRSSQ